MSDPVWPPFDHSRFKPLQVSASGSPDQAVRRFMRRARDEGQRPYPFAMSKSERRRLKDARAAYRERQRTG